MFDGSAQLEELSKEASEAATNQKIPRPQALASHRHTDEGYALDWSRMAAGRLASGDNKAQIFVWEPSSSGTSWTVSGPYKVPYIIHLLVCQKRSAGHCVVEN